MKILVIGGAGYIGSHMVKHLSLLAHAVATFDDLSKGCRESVLHGEFIEGNLSNRDVLDHLFDVHDFDAVMHFASFIEVGESVREPEYAPIDENHPERPINPYDRSKLMVEQMLEDYDPAYGLKSVSLRYFNAAGADVEGEIGERHNPETHLILLVLHTASGRREKVSVFGNNYDTPDGTCVRDYIHFQDLCDAHILALRTLLQSGLSNQYNLGNGEGFSVQEVVDCARNVTGKEILTSIESRRPGDPAVLVSDSTRASIDLGWKPKFSNLRNIIETTWHCEQSFFQ